MRREAAAGQRRPRALRLALCTAPATKSALGSPSAVSATKSTREAAAGQRRAVPGGSVYCACHKICTPGCHEIYATGSRRPAATTRSAAGPGGSVYCARHKICTPGSPSAMPATKSTQQAAAGSVHRLRRNLCRACHEIYATGSRGPAVTTRAAAGPGGSVYCACHKICTPGTKRGACHEIWDVMS